MSVDYYKTLGVSKGASQDEIKKAYRKLAHQHHPDKQGGNEAKFKEINEAYQVLSDTKKRAQYDQFGSAGPFGSGPSTSSGQTGRGPFGGWDFSSAFGGQGGINIEDIFDMFSAGGGSVFGGRAQRQETRGQDIQVDLTISLTDALLGGHKLFEIEKLNTCHTINGNGLKPGTEIIACQTCEGKGEVREQVRSLFGKFTRSGICSTCFGAGKLPKETCIICKGEGRTHGKDKLEFDIPGGIEEGTTLELRGKGQAGFRGATPGNLHLHVHIKMPKKLSSKARKLVEEFAKEV